MIKQNHFKIYMFGVVGETRAHNYFEMISFYNSRYIHIYSRYITFSDVIARILRHMYCNLYIKKKKKISQKRSKGIERELTRLF